MSKRLGIILGSIAVLAVIAAIPFLLPLDSYRGSLQSAASRALGREVKITGPLKLALYPEIGISLADVSVSNMAGGRDAQMIGVGKVVAAARLMPLLSGKVEVTKLVLEKPVIHLEVAKDGTANWAFGADKKTPANTRATTGLNNVGVWDVSIEGGEVSYYDARTNTSRAIHDVSLSLNILQGPIAGLNAPLTVKGALTYENQRLNIDGKVDSPAAVLKGNGTHAHMFFGGPVANVDFDGSIANNGRIAGVLKLGSPSLRKALAWSGHPLPPGNGFGLTALESNLSINDGVIVLSNAQIAFDMMHLSGTISFDTKPDVPLIRATFAVDRLNLDSYLAPGATEDSVQAAKAARTASPEEPLALGGLKAVDAKLTLNVSALTVQNVKVDHALVVVDLNGGVLNADLKNLALYGGTGKGTLALDASNDAPKFHNTLDVSGLKVQPFLKDLMGIDRIEGTGAVQFDVSSQGNSEKAMVSALGGRGSMKFSNGAVKGVDLAAVARVVQSVLNGDMLNSAVGGNAQTGYTQMGASFTIAKGVLKTSDLKMANAVVQLTGSGSADLSARTLDFHLVPRTVPGKGIAGVNRLDIGIPFNVKGPWAKPSYSPDVKGLTTGIVKGLMNGATAPVDVLKQPGKVLKSLFGR